MWCVLPFHVHVLPAPSGCVLVNLPVSVLFVVCSPLSLSLVPVWGWLLPCNNHIMGEFLRKTAANNVGGMGDMILAELMLMVADQEPC